MAQRTGFTDSALIRLLARLREADGGPGAGADGRAQAEVPMPFAERLSQWLGWTEAISLSAVLNAPPAAAGPVPAARPGTPLDADERDCAAARQALARSIRDDNVMSSAPGRAPRQLLPGEVAAAPATDFAPYRQRYLIRQQAMEAGVDALRERLRTRLAGRSSAASRLAAVDTVMGQVLDARERALLASVPAALEAHFKRLRSAAERDVQAQREEAGAAPSPTAWLDVFRQDMQALLLAELDFRFQPVDGLLEALRSQPTGRALAGA